MDSFSSENDLQEVKRLTLGKENKELPSSPKSIVQKEQQRIKERLNQAEISSPPHFKELSEGTIPQAQARITLDAQKSSAQESAFERLKKMKTPKTFETINNDTSISPTIPFVKPPTEPSPLIVPTDDSFDTRPLREIPTTVTPTSTPFENPFIEKKLAVETSTNTIAWDADPHIDEPIESDFPLSEENAPQSESNTSATQKTQPSIPQKNPTPSATQTTPQAKDAPQKQTPSASTEQSPEKKAPSAKLTEESFLKGTLEQKLYATKMLNGGYKTPIDEFFILLKQNLNNGLDFDQIASILQMDQQLLEKLTLMFEDDGLIQIEYPASLTKKPRVRLKKELAPTVDPIPVGNHLEDYVLIVDFVPARVHVVATEEDSRPVYCLDLPNIGPYTERFLSYIKEEVAESLPIELDEIIDPKKSKRLKKRFFEELHKHLVTYFPHASSDLLNLLSGTLLHTMYGLGKIELIMGDDMLEEIAINSAKTPITVYHRVHGWLKTNVSAGTEEDILNFAAQIGRKIGREITNLAPIMDAHLLSGDRVNATLFPISSEGNTITIRRFARRSWTLVDFIGRAHTMNAEMAALLWLAMQYEMNIVIAGGTASGKTSALNTMLALVPSYHRIISIEDVRELVLPIYLKWNWIPMVTRSANPEGLGEVTMLDLMVSSLRMRPDRIIVGEIRRKKEAETLMEAIETGHSIYSTVHANSSYQVLRRLAEPPMSIPLMQIEQIDLIVVQYRDRKTNRRRTYEIAEIEQTSTGQGLQVNTIYKWSPRTDSWDLLNKPTKLLTLLNLHTGLTESEIVFELGERKEILEWLGRQGLNDLNVIGYIVKMFYSFPNKVKEMAKNNVSADTVLTMMGGYAHEEEE